MVKIYLQFALHFLLQIPPAQNTNTDFRIISYDELLPTIERFSEIGVTSYAQLLFDIPRYQLIVGARDYLFRLSLEGLQKLEDAHWPAAQNTIDMCKQKGQTEDDCHNYIKILLSKDGRVFACGTNAFSPKCSWRDIDSLATVSDEMNGIGMCPYSPHQNVTALIASTGDYYVGSAVDFTARDPAIYRFTGKVPGLRTVQYNHNWLSDPNFIASYEINNFTYFFFRETAVEYINCGKTVYSRVARICQNDEGGQYLLKDNWTTFLKARLNCSIPGEYPFYFNELQSVFYVEQENIFYATFTTPANSILGSAVCAFNITSMEKVFHGPFKYQSNPGAAWEKYSGHSAAQKHFQCKTPSNSGHLDSERYQLMDGAVKPTLNTPLVMEELQRFSHIVVDVVPTKHHEAIHVLFIATMEGIIKKMMVLPRTQQICLLEVLKLFPGNHSQPIRAFKILKDTQSLYVGLENSIMRISVERCNRFKTKRACINGMDPYCGWNSHLQECTVPPQKNPLNSFWQQGFPFCPILTEPDSEGWGEWTLWSVCDNDGYQHRKRICEVADPGSSLCQGSDRQTRMCDDDSSNEITPLGITSKSDSGIRTGHLIAGCIVCFLLGCLVSGVLCYYLVMRRHKKRQILGNKLFTSRAASPNVYVPPKDCFKKCNYSTNSLTRNSKGIPLSREATIKRNGHKINLPADRFE